ncbi:phosphotransferase family protein [Raineyella sp. LH-20]|uniref:phosphotransferase family protein n=1 Tax=Raineyella sp. LH-20 TaxID=3081204 RepID=UPI0029536E5F|nr:phosphotransferase [Raineyella sp. LH-20]WOP17739.1 phosphotransferase [Raineyella sp. LH-20]
MSLIDTFETQSVEEIPPLASPSWWGADSIRRRVRLADGGSVLLRQMHPDARAYASPAVVVAAARAASESGLGPRVLASDAATGELVLEDLSDRMRTATIDDFLDGAALQRLADLLGRIRAEITVPAPAATVFDDIRGLQRLIGSAAPALPRDIAWMAARVADLEAWVEGRTGERRFCHNVGDVSNILLSDDRMVAVDWDLARWADPLQDIGLMLDELAYLPLEPEDVFTTLHQGWDPVAYATARAFGIAEHLRQGLIGVVRDLREPGTIEYSKFADWHFLHLREALLDRRHDGYVAA